MENQGPEEENIIKGIRNLFRLKKRVKLQYNQRFKKSFKTRKRN